jgi:VIT1/CCC1 family predicted Fe2+/Mn2+ transporter
MKKRAKKSEPKRFPEHHNKTNGRLNWLRASVLGANDGIVSIAGLVVGVAGATESAGVIFASGLAGVVAGALSMAAGEYVSVSSQRDTEKALIDQERHEHRHFPDEELVELAMLYEAKGLTTETARLVAEELSAHDAVSAHIDVEHRLDPDDLTNPWHAAVASALSFLAGAAVPMVMVVLSPTSVRIPVTVLSVVAALVVTGSLSAHVGGTSKQRATLRVVIGGVLAMAVTYTIGRLVGVSGL